MGGTGFYIRSLTGDIALAGEWDESLRARLAHEAQTHPPDVMHAWLASLDPQRAAAVQAEDRYRVMRALEVALGARSGRPNTSQEQRQTLRTRGVAYAKVYVDVPGAELERRIEARVDSMLQRGLLEEAERLGTAAVAADAVGYPQALAYLRGFSTRRELRMQLIRATRRYAKRQATWFRSEPDLVRIVSTEPLSELTAVAGKLPGWAT